MQLQLNGSLVVAPPMVTDTTFPESTSTISLTCTPSPKPSQVCSGAKQRNANSPNAFITLSGVGPADDVTQADTLYFRCRSPMQIRLTFYNPINPSAPVVSVTPVNGTYFAEYPQNQYLTLLEVQGSGQIEYLASGQQ